MTLHLPQPTAGLVQLMGQHLKEGDVQEGSTSDTLIMWDCIFWMQASEKKSKDLDDTSTRTCL